MICVKTDWERFCIRILIAIARSMKMRNENEEKPNSKIAMPS